MMPSIFGENLFDNFFNDDFSMFPMLTGRNAAYTKPAAGLMKTDVRETENTYELDIDLPGFKKEDISVDLKDGYLSISASSSTDNSEKDEKGKYIRQERYTGSCRRSFYVGKSVTPSDVSARFEDGILKLSMPKHVEQALPESTSVAIE